MKKFFTITFMFMLMLSLISIGNAKNTIIESKYIISSPTNKPTITNDNIVIPQSDNNKILPQIKVTSQIDPNDLSGYREYIINVTTVSGEISFTSDKMITEHITNIEVSPKSSTTSYNFEMSSSDSIIDKNRILHTGNWFIEKSNTIDDYITIDISNSSVDEEFIIKIKYLT